MRSHALRRRLYSIGLVLLAAVAGCLAPAAGAASRSRLEPKPDLIVSGKPVVDPDDILLGATGVHFRARTENRKKAKAVARASETALVLVHPPDQRPAHGDEIVWADVPKLKPGASHRVGARGKARGFEFGEYRAKICADFEEQVNESNEHNNCSDAGDVYVIAGSWTGTLQGTSPVDTGVTETWTSEDAVFVWDGGKPPPRDGAGSRTRSAVHCTTRSRAAIPMDARIAART